MALREINLVPSNFLARREMIRHLSFWAGCLVILLAPVFGFYAYRVGEATAQNNAIANPDDIRKHLSDQVNAVKQIQKELELLNEQQSELQTEVRYSDYSKILFKLADTVNAYTWLKSLRIDSGSNPKDPTTLQISGSSTTNKALGNFLNRLGSNPLFENVVLKHATETLMEKSGVNDRVSPNRVDFEIACGISNG